MSNYERLCKYLGIKLEYGYTIKNKEVYIKNCNKAGVIALFSKKTDLKVVEVNKEMNFTAEKQIELIKLLMNTGCFTGYAYKIEVKKYMLSCKLKNYYNEDFAETLAGLTLKLIIEARELNKDEVRKVLK